MTQSDKFTAILGFAKRAGKVIYGYDTLKKARGAKIYAVSSTASENLTDSMKKLALSNGLPLIVCEDLEQTAGANCKALGITDPGMAKGILDYVNGAQKSTIYRLTEEL